MRKVFKLKPTIKTEKRDCVFTNGLIPIGALALVLRNLMLAQTPDSKSGFSMRDLKRSLSDYLINLAVTPTFESIMSSDQKSVHYSALVPVLLAFCQISIDGDDLAVIVARAAASGAARRGPPEGRSKSAHRKLTRLPKRNQKQERPEEAPEEKPRRRPSINT